MDARGFRSNLTLAAMPRAAYWARRHTEEVLTEWKLDMTVEGLVDSALLVVTELVTNAVQATGELRPELQKRYSEQPLAVSYMELANLGQVRLRLSYDYVRVVIEVWDGSEAIPVMQRPSEEAVSGRGLMLVAAHCSRWD
jgi:hypothetical protein